MSKSDRFKRFFLKDWRLILSAVFLALLSYYAIRGATSFEVTYDVPLLVEVESGIAILEQDPMTLSVTFRGSQEDLRQLDQQQIRALVRPRVVEPAGAETVTVRDRNIEGVSGARVVQIRPRRVSVVYDREAEKRVSVAKPKTSGTPLEGEVELAYEPRSVLIRGPKLRLDDISLVTTVPIDVDGRVQSFSKKVKVLSPGDTWVSEIDPAEVTVKVNIVTDRVSREWEGIHVMALMQPDYVKNVKFSPATVTVSLHGRPELLESVAGSGTMVFVDCRGLAPKGEHELPVNVYSPYALDVEASVDPAVVRVTFPAAEPVPKPSTAPTEEHEPETSEE